ncbi:hypothetical protein J6590_072887 [Homalodisca vitripennis]|nr:hypothetical protein J6590_072887 [Homalodisca vitripennis]
MLFTAKFSLAPSAASRASTSISWGLSIPSAEQSSLFLIQLRAVHSPRPKVFRKNFLQTGFNTPTCLSPYNTVPDRRDGPLQVLTLGLDSVTFEQTNISFSFQDNSQNVLKIFALSTSVNSEHFLFYLPCTLLNHSTDQVSLLLFQNLFL